MSDYWWKKERVTLRVFAHPGMDRMDELDPDNIDEYTSEVEALTYRGIAVHPKSDEPRVRVVTHIKSGLAMVQCKMDWSTAMDLVAVLDELIPGMGSMEAEDLQEAVKSHRTARLLIRLAKCYPPARSMGFVPPEFRDRQPLPADSGTDPWPEVD